MSHFHYILYSKICISNHKMIIAIDSVLPTVSYSFSHILSLVFSIAYH